jgi:fibrillarin-like rRNA methylase
VIGNAIREFIDLCSSLSVNVQQRTADDLLRMVEELPNIIPVAR